MLPNITGFYDEVKDWVKDRGERRSMRFKAQAAGRLFLPAESDRGFIAQSSEEARPFPE